VGFGRDRDRDLSARDARKGTSPDANASRPGPAWPTSLCGEPVFRAQPVIFEFRTQKTAQSRGREPPLATTCIGSYTYLYVPLPTCRTGGRCVSPRAQPPWRGACRGARANIAPGRSVATNAEAAVTTLARAWRCIVLCSRSGLSFSDGRPQARRPGWMRPGFAIRFPPAATTISGRLGGWMEWDGRSERSERG
jgi:hypothetical protein